MPEIDINMIKMVAEVEPMAEHDDNGPGIYLCPICGEWAHMEWEFGFLKNDSSSVVHAPNCIAEYSRKLLKNHVS